MLDSDDSVDESLPDLSVPDLDSSLYNANGHLMVI